MELVWPQLVTPSTDASQTDRTDIDTSLHLQRLYLGFGVKLMKTPQIIFMFPSSYLCETSGNIMFMTDTPMWMYPLSWVYLRALILLMPIGPLDNSTMSSVVLRWFISHPHSIQSYNKPTMMSASLWISLLDLAVSWPYGSSHGRTLGTSWKLHQLICGSFGLDFANSVFQSKCWLQLMPFINKWYSNTIKDNFAGVLSANVVDDIHNITYFIEKNIDSSKCFYITIEEDIIQCKLYSVTILS